MSTEQTIVTPVCPHCAKPLPEIGMYFWKINELTMFRAGFCPHCRKTLMMDIYDTQVQIQLPTNPNAPQMM